MQTSKPRIAATVLAAGLSRRMGRFKPLLPFGGKPLLARVIESVITSGGVAPVVVVTGYGADQLAPILADFSARAVLNSAYATGGMLSSIQTGLAAIRGDADAVLIVLGDQPMVRPQTIAALASAWTCSDPRPRVVLPTCTGKHGHPILLCAQGIDEILALPADATLRTYTQRHIARTLEVRIDDDPAILHDLDTPDDYAAALQRWRDGSNERDISVRSPLCPSERTDC